jgi:TrmH family RNA methyltransferase
MNTSAPQGARRDPLGPRNPRIGTLRRLVDRRSEREAAGVFVVDGPVLVAEALSADVVVRELYCDADHLGDPAISAVVAAARSASVRVQVTQPGVIARVADPVTPRPLVAVVERPNAPVATRLPAERAVDAGILVLVAVRDPGNTGTLIRTAEAAGMAAVWVVGDGADPFGPKAVRASAGSVLRVPVAVHRDAAVAVASLAAAGHTLVGTSADGVAYDELDPGSAPALLLGSEAHGLDPEVSALVDRWVSVPMSGEAESLNVAVAGSVLAFELARRRRIGSDAPGPAR